MARRAGRPYELQAGAYCVMLISQHEGRIVSDAGMREIEALPSFAGTISMLGPGDRSNARSTSSPARGSSTS